MGLWGFSPPPQKSGVANMSRRRGSLAIRLDIDPVKTSFVCDVVIDGRTISSQWGATRAEAATKCLGHLIAELLRIDSEPGGAPATVLAAQPPNAPQSATVLTRKTQLPTIPQPTMIDGWDGLHTIDWYSAFPTKASRVGWVQGVDDAS